MASDSQILEGLGDYKYGFKDPETHVFKSSKGLNRDIVEQISAMKGEPAWMLEFRLKALDHFMKRPMPTQGGDLSKLNLDEIFFYVKPAESESRSWEDVPEAIKNTFVLIPWNRPEVFAELAQAESHEIAGIIMNPVDYNNGCITTTAEYLRQIREICDRHGIILILGKRRYIFPTTMEKAPIFIAALKDEAAQAQYEPDDIGVYLQPIENGRVCHLEFTMPYNPGDAHECGLIRKLHRSASERAYALGAHFTRAYGIWAEMVYGRNAVHYQTEKMIKETLDPNNIMNPGTM